MLNQLEKFHKDKVVFVTGGNTREDLELSMRINQTGKLAISASRAELNNLRTILEKALLESKSKGKDKD